MTTAAIKEILLKGPRRSSQAMNDLGRQLNRVGLKFGQFVLNRTPGEWIVQHTPDKMTDAIRMMVAEGFEQVGDRWLASEEQVQQKMNGKMFINAIDPATKQPLLEEVSADFIKGLFPYGKPKEWPRQLIFCTKDIVPNPAYMHSRMQNIPMLIENIVSDKPKMLRDPHRKAKNKLVVIGGFYTENTVLHNASAILHRVKALRQDPLTLDHMCPVAKVMGESILGAMTLRKEGETTLLRDDAPEIMRHVMMHGFSQGGNVLSDVFRYMRRQMLLGDYRLAMDGNGTESRPIGTDEEIGKIFAGSYIFNLASADIPFTTDELVAMPPRDTVRSNVDVVVTSAVGTQRQQSNYNYIWRQDKPDNHRKDRLIESFAPNDRLLENGQWYGDHGHAYLGHGEKIYWKTEVEQARIPLQERLMTRFSGKAVATDITFQNDTVTIELERGIPPKRAKSIANYFVRAIEVMDREITELPMAHPSPYTLRLKVPRDLDTLTKIGDALTHCNIIPAREVGYLLGLRDGLTKDAGEKWLQKRLERPLPGAKVTSHYGNGGPYYKITKEDGFSEKDLARLQNGMDKHLHIPLKLRLSDDGNSVNVPFDGIVASIKIRESLERRQQEVAESRLL